MPNAEFRALAENLIAIVDQTAALERDELEARLRLALPPLYAAGVVGRAELEAASEEPLPVLTHDHALPHEEPEEHLALFGRIVSALEVKLGDHDAFRMVADPYAPTAEPVQSSLADAITDLYIDLRQGVALDDSGDERAAAERWFFAFGHWGAHALEALWALHALAERTPAE